MTVSGLMYPATVIKKLNRAGKPANLWGAKPGVVSQVQKLQLGGAALAARASNRRMPVARASPRVEWVPETPAVEATVARRAQSRWRCHRRLRSSFSNCSSCNSRCR